LLATTGGATACFGLSMSIAPPPNAAITATSAKICTGRLIVVFTERLSARAQRRFTAQDA
jgi:hypothetical protein